MKHLSKVYGEYSSHYDFLTNGKDYKMEADFINQVFEQYGDGEKTVADMGCGTGNHLFHLYSSHRFRIHGVDLSDAFIKMNKEEYLGKEDVANFYLADDSKVELKEKVNIIVNMFSSFNHKLTPQEAVITLKNYHFNLNKKGLVLIDLLSKEHFMNRLHKPCKRKDKHYATEFKVKENGNILITKNYNYLYQQEKMAYSDTFEYHLYNEKEIADIIVEAGFSNLEVRRSFFPAKSGNRLIMIARK